VLQALGALPTGQIPVSAICFSYESLSLLVLNQLAVAEIWDPATQCETQSDIFETVFLTAGKDLYDEISIGEAFHFSANWAGGSARVGPVKGLELYESGDRPRVLHLHSAKIHCEYHLGRSYEFLVEMPLFAPTTEWRLSPIANFPNFLSLM